MSLLSSKSDVFIMRQPKNKRCPVIPARLILTSGRLTIQVLQRGLTAQIAAKLASGRDLKYQYDLKVVWISDMPDDTSGEIIDCFVIVTPEKSHILQADSRRKKIDWMQSVTVCISQSFKFRNSYRPSSWSQLGDLQKWLDRREVSYTYSTGPTAHPQYKGATYTGKWNMGMPHLWGCMRWTCGDHYEGEFLNGRFHGSGTMLWLTHEDYRSYTGSWQDGIVEGFGELSYRDQRVYVGWWHQGQQHGHGCMANQLSGEIYIGNWAGNCRSGYGVSANGERSRLYLGMWKHDRYHGPGILLEEGKAVFEGFFENGQKIMPLPGSPLQDGVDLKEKWHSLFHKCSAMLEQLASVEHANQDSQLRRVRGLESDQRLLTVPGNANVTNERERSRASKTTSCPVCSAEGFRTSHHPLGILVTHLTKAFNLSYGSPCPALLSHAVNELRHMLERTSEIVSLHCPHLTHDGETQFAGYPRSHLSVLLTPLDDVGHLPARVGKMDWLHPIFVPPVYDTLISLYQTYHQHEEEQLYGVLSEMHWYSVEELLQTFLPQDVDQELPDDNDLAECIKIFSQLSSFRTPQNKLLCLRDTHQEIRKVAQELPPLLQACWCCVMIQTRQRSILSQLSFLQDFASEAVETDYRNSFLAAKDACSRLKEFAPVHSCDESKAEAAEMTSEP